jgi:hypothetical protein
MTSVDMAQLADGRSSQPSSECLLIGSGNLCYDMYDTKNTNNSISVTHTKHIKVKQWAETTQLL